MFHSTASASLIVVSERRVIGHEPGNATCGFSGRANHVHDRVFQHGDLGRAMRSATAVEVDSVGRAYRRADLRVLHGTGL